jgi:serine protease Do
MRTAPLLALAVAAALTALPVPSRAAGVAPEALPDLLARLMPAVVNITVHTLVTPPTSSLNAAGTLPTPNAQMQTRTLVGSGFVIDPSGLIVTNTHVVAGGYDVTATFQDGTSMHADVVATAKLGDIALIQVHAGHKLPTVPFGDSTQLRVGQQVMTVGNPLGYGGSVSLGIISALNRNITLSPFDDFIQTDAALNHGNSGGPLFNMQGEVVGVNTALVTPEDNGGSVGLGFALPAYCVQFEVDQLRRSGVVRLGTIGVSLQDVTNELAAGLGLPESARTPDLLPGSAGWGVIVTRVEPDGPAAKVGLQDGDILLAVDHQPVADMRAFARMVAVQPIGRPVAIDVWRDGTLQTVTPVVGEFFAAEQQDRATLAASQRLRTTLPFGLHLAALTETARQARDLPPGEPGVAIDVVETGSVAGNRGLQPGDVIIKVMNQPVASPNEVEQQLQMLRDAHHDMAVLLVDGTTGPRFVALPLVTSSQ